MKKITILTAIAGLTLGASLAYGYTVDGGGVVGSKHDMNMLSGAADDGQKRVCAFCHTPHHKLDADGLVLDYNPLWSHEYNSDKGFTAYDTTTFNSTTLDDPLAGPSRLCMSCHDGSIAVDQHYGNIGTPSATIGSKITDDAFGDIAVGRDSDVSNDHPIGFSLVGIADKDPGIRSILLTPGNDKIAATALITTLGYNTGSDTIMTCASCHDVHNKDNVDTAFLYEKQENSQFCVMCHDK